MDNNFIDQIKAGIEGLAKMIEDKKSQVVSTLSEKERSEVESKFSSLNFENKIKEMRDTFDKLSEQVKK